MGYYIQHLQAAAVAVKNSPTVESWQPVILNVLMRYEDDGSRTVDRVTVEKFTNKTRLCKELAERVATVEIEKRTAEKEAA